MEVDAAMQHVRADRRGVLVTIRKDGRPQLSNIMYAVDDAGVVKISVTASRAKTKNLQRDPRASLYVCSDDFWRWVVIDGEATLSAVAAKPDDAAADELVELYRALSGEHENWDEYRRAMVDDQRLVIRLSPSHAYGILPS
jgi:PPOX class probable F420-dependent enzyme